MTDDRGAFRCSSHCEGGACLEVGQGATEVRLRDAVQPDVELRVPREDFADFLDAVKRGEFDSPS